MYVVNVGAQKAGTTFIESIVRETKLVNVPKKTKELHYFDREPVRDYKSLFLDYGNDLWFESTPSYLHFPGVAKRINRELRGDVVRILIMHRHPVDRAYSQYLMNRAKNYEDLRFDHAIRRFYSSDRDLNYYRYFAYVERGMYYENASKYIDVFGQDNVFFLELSSLKDHEGVARLLNRMFDYDVFSPGCELRAPRDNKGGVIENNFVRWLYANKHLRTLCRSVVDPKALHRLKSRFQSAYPVLAEEQRETLMNEYFISDYEKFKQLLHESRNAL